MKLQNFHKNLKLNGTSFTSVQELLNFAKEFDKDIYEFLENWFDGKTTIAVKTSGSTGKPKSILLKKELMQNSAKGTGHFFDLPEKTSALLCLPIQYIAGKMMLLRALTLGWHLDIVSPNANPLQKINKKYQFSAMVPLQLENSLSKIDLIRTLIVGGGVVSNSLQNKLQKVSTSIYATYGMTETITHIAVKKLNKHTTWQERFLKKTLLKKTFYKTLPHVTIYKDERNCLVIDSPNVTDDVVFTNDVVNLISDTQFEWLGRFDNVINTGGVKIHPEKVEEQLSKLIQHRFFITGIKDATLGEKIILVIEGTKDTALEKEVLDTTLLTKFEKPKAIYFLDHFIETPTGKIQRGKTLGVLKLT